MGEHKRKKQSVGIDTSEETMINIECAFMQGWCELMNLAYKKEGMLGVLQLSYELAKRADAVGVIAEKEAPGYPNLQRSTVAASMVNGTF